MRNIFATSHRTTDSTIANKSAASLHYRDRTFFEKVRSLWRTETKKALIWENFGHFS